MLSVLAERTMAPHQLLLTLRMPVETSESDGKFLLIALLPKDFSLIHLGQTRRTSHRQIQADHAQKVQTFG